MNQGFEPSLFDKLFDDSPVGAARRRLSLEQLKDTVARDLEALLNTRVLFDDGLAEPFPQAKRSVAGYGLADFAGLSMANVHHRREICASIESAIAAHEPRLREVRVDLEVHRNTVNALYFAINAVLHVRPTESPVSFDALLQPTSLQYSVSRNRLRMNP